MERLEFLKNFGIIKKPFRTWMVKKYYENQKERELWNDESISPEEYFKRNRWYLKGKYKQKISS